MLIPDFYSIREYEFENDSIKATISLHAEHAIFKGHFPDNPVMPGVCMLQIFKELSETALDKKLVMTACNNVKFTALINPFVHSLLHIDIDLSPIDMQSYKISGSAQFGDTTALKVKASLHTQAEWKE